MKCILASLFRWPKLLYHYNVLPEWGWEGFYERMEGISYPPSDNDRKKMLDQDWGETVPRMKLQQIEDEDIRRKTYFLTQVVEQCMRFKSIAKFYEVLNVSNDDWYASKLFIFWKEYDLHKALLAEAEYLDDEKLINKMKEKMQFNSMLFGVFAIDPKELCFRMENLTDEDREEARRLIELGKTLSNNQDND